MHGRGNPGIEHMGGRPAVSGGCIDGCSVTHSDDAVVLDGIAAGCVFPGFQRVAAICSKPYDYLTITEAMARLLASDDPKARSF